jgi:hypothetical protein
MLEDYGIIPRNILKQAISEERAQMRINQQW